MPERSLIASHTEKGSFWVVKWDEDVGVRWSGKHRTLTLIKLDLAGATLGFGDLQHNIGVWYCAYKSRITSGLPPNSTLTSRQRHC